MTFAISRDFNSFLLLKKPANHKNVMFRDRWTVPGGLIEEGESDLESAIREMREETNLKIGAQEMRLVMTFPCNCDPTEPEHEVVVYAAWIGEERMRCAEGTTEEPVRVFKDIPINCLWYVPHLMAIAIGRIKQPLY